LLLFFKSILNPIIVFNIYLKDEKSVTIYLKDEDIRFTNWGISGSEFEPREDPALLCASVCLGNNCSDETHTWKVESCDSAPIQQFICQVECKLYLMN
jgi:hypothetical protein